MVTFFLLQGYTEDKYYSDSSNHQFFNLSIPLCIVIDFLSHLQALKDVPRQAYYIATKVTTN